MVFIPNHPVSFTIGVNTDSQSPELLAPQLFSQMEKLRQEEILVVPNQGPTIYGGTKKPRFKWRRDSLNPHLPHGTRSARSLAPS